MSQQTTENCLEVELKKCIEKHGEKINACINYISIIETYSKLIQRSQTLDEAKDWAHRMIDHALKVKS